MHRIFLLIPLLSLVAVAARADEPRRHDPFATAAAVRRYSFELDEDHDFDGLPDEWTRRRGPEFPAYVTFRIDDAVAADGSRSLRVDANGGQAAIYSPPIPVDSVHAWLFEGRIRTQQLENDAAAISISFLDSRRQRIRRVLSRPVTGTLSGWAEVRIGPVSPPDDARYVVIGCHLIEGRRIDIRGSAWFDGLRVLRLPQLSLISNFRTHFRARSGETRIQARVGGLEPGRRYELFLEAVDGGGRLVAEARRPLDASDVADAELPPGVAGSSDPTPREAPPERGQTIEWTLPPLDYGYFEVRAGLHSDGALILEAHTSFAVLDLVESPARGEFGWSVETDAAAMPLNELADVASQSGVSWLKYPVWSTGASGDAAAAARVSEFLDSLSHRGITPVGVLSDPPGELRSKFAREWTGISEIFGMPSSFWSPSLVPVLARYSSAIQHWQLGDDSDASFVGMSQLPRTLADVKRTFDRIGRNTRVGVNWPADADVPSAALPPQTFFSASDRTDGDDRSPATGPQPRGSAVRRWVVLKPLPSSRMVEEDRAADLVKRMVQARLAGADAIFAADVLHPDHGLLTPHGAPTRLYLPWRTTAVALQGTERLGSLQLRSQSTNHVFARPGETVIIVWNDRPVTEEIYLGENVVAVDIWGRQQPLSTDSKTGRQSLSIGPTPLILCGCSEPVARWRLAMTFEKGRLPSAYGEHRDAIVGVNTFPQGTSGQVTVMFPPEWVVAPSSWTLQTAAGESFRLPLALTLPPNASLGTRTAVVQFEIMSDRPYRFEVFRPYEVGLGDVLVSVSERMAPDGRLEVEQLITNRTSPPEVLNFRCSLFVPGQKRQILFVTKLGQGQDRKFYYVPDGESLRGRELWIRAEEVGGLRMLNYRWKVGEAARE